MKNVDLTNVQEAGNYEKLPAGGYCVKILKVEDVPEKEYLRIYFDVTDGQYKGFYKKQYDADTREEKQWSGNFIRSYKESALPFFKALTTSLENSNKGYKFDGNDEQSFVNKQCGIIVGYEEYINNNGKKRERPVIEPHSIDKIKKGEFEVPELKRLDPSKEIQNKPAFNDPFADNSSSQKETDPFAASDDNPFA